MAARESARPTPKMKRLYHWFSERLGGEPPDLWVYETDRWKPPPDRPAANRPVLKHVMVWPADDDVDVTGFQTIGMSERSVPGTPYFAELHMAVRSFLRKPDRERIARFLANVAEYPFDHQQALDWWHTLANPGDIPQFPGCKHLLPHPKLTEEGFDTVEDPDGLIKVFYVVPITPRERHLVVEHGPDALLDYLDEEEIDLLSDRTDPPDAPPTSPPPEAP